MRFMTIYSSTESDAPPTQDEMDRMGAFIQEMADAGHLERTDGLLPSSRGVRVRREHGKVTVTDGPFTEAKEVVGGYAIMHFDTLGQAVEMTKRFLEVAGDGVGSSRVDLQACKLEYSIVSPK